MLFKTPTLVGMCCICIQIVATCGVQRVVLEIMGVERLTTSMEKSRCVLKSGSGGGDDECTKENAMEFWLEAGSHDPGNNHE